jgi:mRNA interferase MazF
VVLQNDIANDRLKTVMVAPLTSNLKAEGYLLTVLVDAKRSGLPKDSVILLFQIRTLDKRRLERKIVYLDDTIMEQVNQAIQIAFAL